MLIYRILDIVTKSLARGSSRPSQLRVARPSPYPQRYDASFLEHPSSFQAYDIISCERNLKLWKCGAGVLIPYGGRSFKPAFAVVRLPTSPVIAFPSSRVYCSGDSQRGDFGVGCWLPSRRCRQSAVRVPRTRRMVMGQDSSVVMSSRVR